MDGKTSNRIYTNNITLKTLCKFHQSDKLVQERHSNALAMEFRLSCINSSKYSRITVNSFLKKIKLSNLFYFIAQCVALVAWLKMSNLSRVIAIKSAAGLPYGTKTKDRKYILL